MTASNPLTTAEREFADLEEAPEPPPNACAAHPPHVELSALYCRDCGIFKCGGLYYRDAVSKQPIAGGPHGA